VLASATLIVVFSAILYNYIKISIYEDLNLELIKEATRLTTEQSKALNAPNLNIFKYNKKN